MSPESHRIADDVVSDAEMRDVEVAPPASISMIAVHHTPPPSDSDDSDSSEPKTSSNSSSDEEEAEESEDAEVSADADISGVHHDGIFYREDEKEEGEAEESGASDDEQLDSVKDSKNKSKSPKAKSTSSKSQRSSKRDKKNLVALAHQSDAVRQSKWILKGSSVRLRSKKECRLQKASFQRKISYMNTKTSFA